MRVIYVSYSPSYRFTVYIVIPMHPEGVPSDSAIQEMLYWQHHTMQMMYSRIAHAIYASGLMNLFPTVFICLSLRHGQSTSFLMFQDWNAIQLNTSCFSVWVKRRPLKTFHLTLPPLPGAPKRLNCENLEDT